jgi:hypothetical protein
MRAWGYGTNVAFPQSETLIVISNRFQEPILVEARIYNSSMKISSSS